MNLESRHITGNNAVALGGGRQHAQVVMASIAYTIVDVRFIVCTRVSVVASTPRILSMASWAPRCQSSRSLCYCHLRDKPMAP